MANMLKVSNMKDIGHLDMHYKRGVPKGHYSNPDINQDMLKDDRTNFGPARYQKDAEGKMILDKEGSPIERKITDYIKETIDRLYEGKTLRKDAVKMVSWVVDAPKNMNADLKPKFFQEAYNFLVDRYGSKSGLGENVVLSCYWHKSETTDHIHFAFMPILDRNGIKTFCAKEVVGRADLKSFHDDLEKYMVDRGICKKGDIQNGHTLKDSNGRALSIRELKALGHTRERSATHREPSRWDKTTDFNHNIERKTGRW